MNREFMQQREPRFFSFLITYRQTDFCVVCSRVVLYHVRKFLKEEKMDRSAGDNSGIAEPRMQCPVYEVRALEPGEPIRATDLFEGVPCGPEMNGVVMPAAFYFIVIIVRQCRWFDAIW